LRDGRSAGALLHVEEVERAMTRKSRPVVDALEMAAAYLDGRLGPRGQVGRA
jgi:hypothetical protein